MNILKFTLIVLCSTTSSMMLAMELPTLPDQKKVWDDKRVLVAGLKAMHYSLGESAILDIGNTCSQKDVFLQNFKSTWEERASRLARLDFTFASYMKQAGIDSNWIETEEQIKNNTRISATAFITLIRNRFTNNLAKYTPDYNHKRLSK